MGSISINYAGNFTGMQVSENGQTATATPPTGCTGQQAMSNPGMTGYPGTSSFTGVLAPNPYNPYSGTCPPPPPACTPAPVQPPSCGCGGVVCSCPPPPVQPPPVQPPPVQPPPVQPPPVGTLPRDVADWASKLGLGNQNKAMTSANNINTYSFDNGLLDIDANTGAPVDVNESFVKAPTNVVMLALEEQLGMLKSITAATATTGPVFNFANGNITTATDGVTIVGATGGANRDAMMQAIGQSLGMGTPGAITTTNENPPQKEYTFANGKLYSDPASGKVNGGTINGNGLNAPMINLAFLRGMGAFQTSTPQTNGFLDQFANGSIHVSTASGWTVDQAKVNS